MKQKSLFNVINEFGTLCKLVALIKTCMEKTQYKIRVNQTAKAWKITTDKQNKDY